MSCLLVLTLFVSLSVAEVSDLEIEVLYRPNDCITESKNGDMLKIQYTGKLENGSIFDSTNNRPSRKPIIFRLGAKEVIQGLDMGLLNMCEGEKRKLTIPPHMGYGEKGSPPKVPGGATLMYGVKLLRISSRDEL